MTNREVQDLIQALVDAFPAAKIEEGTVRLYRRTLQAWRFDTGSEAVQAAIESCAFLPSIAELVSHYDVAHERHRREVEMERTRLERLAEDNMPRPELAEIPAAVEYMARLNAGDVDRELTLERAQDGKCDDCGKDGQRFKLGPGGFCVSCVASRLRAKGHLEGEAAA